MIRDLILILNCILTVLSIRTMLIVIHRNMSKIYQPPGVRAAQLNKQRLVLAIAGFFLGFVIRAFFFTDDHQSAYSLVIGTLMYIALYLCTLQFLHLSREREIIIKDGLELRKLAS